jgi:hypothetical protein
MLKCVLNRYGLILKNHVTGRCEHGRTVAVGFFCYLATFIFSRTVIKKVVTREVYILLLALALWFSLICFCIMLQRAYQIEPIDICKMWLGNRVSHGRKKCRLWSYGLCQTVVLQMLTNVSEDYISSIFRIILKMELIRYSETLMTTYQTAWRHNP